MKLFQAVDQRYTTKVYDATRGLDSQIINKLKHIVHMCPSSINSQPWRVTFVEDVLVKERLAEASYFNAEKIKQAPLLIVFSRCAQLATFEEWLYASQPVGAVEYYEKFVKPQSVEEIFAWFTAQLYINIGMILAATATMEIDSSPMEGIERSKYDMILGQKGHTAIAAIAVGYRDTADYNDPIRTAKSRRDIVEVVRSI